MSPALPLKIQRRTMRSNTIIPHHNRPPLPLDSDLSIPQPRLHIKQQPQQRIRLLLLHPHNIPRKLLIDKHRLGTRDGVHAHERVRRGHRLATYVATRGERVGGLFVRGVHCGEGRQEGLKRGRETRVEMRLGEKESVASGGGPILCGREVEDRQESGAGRVNFVCHIRMPRHGRDAR